MRFYAVNVLLLLQVVLTTPAKSVKKRGVSGGRRTCTGDRRINDCFTAYFKWRSGGAGEVYANIAEENDQRQNYCDDSNVICNHDGYGDSLCLGQWYFRTGQWQRISQYVRLNTPGQTDGYIRVYFNGRKVCEVSNISIRKGSNFNIDGIFFSAFLDGADSSVASKYSTYGYFKNFALSTKVNIG